jgi:SAM-dependent methyltransferase
MRIKIKRIKSKIKKLKMSRRPNIIEKITRKIEVIKDRMNGLDFLTVIPTAQLGLDPKLVSQCSPSGNGYLTSLLKEFLVTESDDILDIGCGKGSAILRMTECKFNNIDGIEIVKQHAEVAKTNFKKLGIQNVQIFNEDATQFNGYNKYNYFYMYNPFPRIVMQLVISRILEQTSVGRKITIIYNNPVCHEVLISAGLNIIKVYPDQWGNGINVYSNIKNEWNSFNVK